MQTCGQHRCASLVLQPRAVGRHAHHPFTARPVQRCGSPSGQRHHISPSAVAATIEALAPTFTLPGLPLFGGSKLDRAQQAVLDAISSSKGRGKTGVSPEQQASFDEAVAVLEAAGGIRGPVASPLLEGRWRLVYTTRPGTASPIQRSFTGVDAFSVYQEIDLSGDSARVNNIVDFGRSVGYLKVEAEASTERRPIPGFVPRRGSGLPFGLLGVSSTEPPARKDLRIDFAFDRAAFYFNALPVTIPYPVPFRLLADERKGWLDITYLSPDGRFRLSRGNKGTTFVLVKDEPPQQALLEAVAARAPEAQIEALVEAAGAAGGSGRERAPARSALAAGTWRQVWSKQGATANPLQRTLANQVGNFQIIDIGGDGATLENRVEIGPFFKVKALAECTAASATRTTVKINEVVIEAGPFRFELPIKTDGTGFIDWLYLDGSMRITRGSKGSLFVHKKVVEK